MNAKERRAAWVAGLGLLVMAALAGYANVGVIEHAGTASATELLGATVAMAVVAVLDVIVAWGFVGLFRADAPRSTALAAWTRIAYAGLLAVAVGRLAIERGDGLAGARAFHEVFDPALGLFGVHLLMLAWPVAHTRHARVGVRLVLAAVVAIAGLGYFVDAAAPLVIGRSPHIALFTFVGEVVLMVWLLVAAARGKPG